MTKSPARPGFLCWFPDKSRMFKHPAEMFSKVIQDRLFILGSFGEVKKQAVSRLYNVVIVFGHGSNVLFKCIAGGQGKRAFCRHIRNYLEH